MVRRRKKHQGRRITETGYVDSKESIVEKKYSSDNDTLQGKLVLGELM